MTDSRGWAVWTEVSYERPASRTQAIWFEVAHSVETGDPEVAKLQPIMTVTTVVLPIIEEA